MTGPAWTLRATVEHLEHLERLPGSPGEREAAHWIRDRLAEVGLEARLEEAPITGSFTLPLGLMSAAAGLAGLIAPRTLAAVTAAAASAGIVDDTSGGPQVFRRVLPRRTTLNVVAEAGDPAAPQTLVVSAHHDAARGGLIFHPAPTVAVARAFPGFYARQQTSPQFMRVVAGGPAHNGPRGGPPRPAPPPAPAGGAVLCAAPLSP